MITVFANSMSHEVEYWPDVEQPYRVDGDVFLRERKGEIPELSEWFRQVARWIGWDADAVELSRIMHSMAAEWGIPLDESELDGQLRRFIMAHYAITAGKGTAVNA